MSTPEGKIQLAILKHLREEGVFCWRNNNQPTHDPKMNSGYGGYRAQSAYAAPGAPDIMCILDGGVFAGFEVKTKTGRQSADQKLFEKRCDSRGALYHVVRSVADVKELGLR